MHQHRAQGEQRRQPHGPPPVEQGDPQSAQQIQPPGMPEAQRRHVDARIDQPFRHRPGVALQRVVGVEGSPQQAGGEFEAGCDEGTGEGGEQGRGEWLHDLALLGDRLPVSGQGQSSGGRRYTLGAGRRGSRACAGWATAAGIAHLGGPRPVPR
ncbi:hypothetical protein D3C81_1774990 [compost metagenome]